MNKHLWCPKCGKTPKETGAFIEGFCPNCYFSQHPLIELHHTPEVKICSRCESYWSNGKWVTKGTNTIEEHLHNIACDILDQILTPSQPATYEITILDEPEQPITQAKKIRVEVSAQAQKANYTETKIILLHISSVLCDTCKRVAGGYFEALLQVRASTGKLTQEQEKNILAFLNEQLAHLEAPPGTIKLAHLRGGIDIKFISSRLCKSLAKQVATHFGLIFGVSSKVVGRTRTGKPQTRHSYVVRFPPFTVGDVLLYKNQIYAIERISNGNYVFIDLESGHKRTYSPKELSSFEGKSLSDDVQVYQVISKTPEFYQLMSKRDFTIFDIPASPFSLKVGTTVRAVLWKKRPYILPHPEE
jgi:nonsense-mediated mRNA decay protein 3